MCCGYDVIWKKCGERYITTCEYPPSPPQKKKKKNQWKNPLRKRGKYREANIQKDSEKKKAR